MKLLPMLQIILLLLAGGGRVPPQKHQLGNLKNKTIADGCGCYFQFPGTGRNTQKYMFFSSVEDKPEKEAWINLDGKDVKLTMVSKIDQKGRERVGSRRTRTYAAPGVGLQATYIATRVCKPNEENCEATDYAATFRLTIAGHTQIIKAVGGCGC